MAHGVLILDIFYLTVWLTNSLVAPQMVGAGEIVVGIVLPIVSAMAILLGRSRGASGLEPVLRWVALSLNGAVLLHTLPSVAFAVLDSVEPSQSFEAADLQAGAILLLLLAMNLVVLRPRLAAA